MNLRALWSSRRGLTLTEILVAIAIIAILLAILLPLLFRSRGLSYRAMCLSNMRQLGDAFEMYADDYSGWWPSPGGLAGDYAYWSQTGAGGLESYVNQRGVGSVWCCPIIKQWHGRFPARTYSMNSYLRRPADIEYPTCLNFLCGINLNTIEEPDKTILLFEGITLQAYFQDQLDYLYRCANWTRVRGYYPNIAGTEDSGTPWHEPVNNYLFCDGHAKSRPPGKKTVGQLSTWYEMYEWYVSKEYFKSRYGEEP